MTHIVTMIFIREGRGNGIMADSGSLNSSLVRLWPSHFDSLRYLMTASLYDNKRVLAGIDSVWVGLFLRQGPTLYSLTELTLDM